MHASYISVDPSPKENKTVSKTLVEVDGSIPEEARATSLECSL